MKPGTTLLKVAPLLFNERFLAVAVRPTIADFQCEFAAAGTYPENGCAPVVVATLRSGRCSPRRRSRRGPTTLQSLPTVVSSSVRLVSGFLRSLHLGRG